jgi:hypothetical protein
MTFVFEDGAHVDVEAKQAPSFMSNDLNWALLAHGKLTNVLYGKRAKVGGVIGGSYIARALRVPVRKCTSWLSRMACALRQGAGKKPHKEQETTQVMQDVA